MDAYVRGACSHAGTVPLDSDTACFATRRARDKFNAEVQTRIAKHTGRSLRVDAVFTSAADRTSPLSTIAAGHISCAVRSQSLLSLHIAGHWPEDKVKPLFMRAMLVANVDVENAFANGTRGYVVRSSPDPSE